MLVQFALRLICGVSLMLGLMPRKTVASGFFRVQMLIVLGFAVLAALAAQSVSAAPAGSILVAYPWIRFAVSIGCAATAFVGSVLWTLERRSAGVVCIAVCAVLSFAGLAAGVSATTPVAMGLELAGELASSALLGAMLTAMLVGHSYLTAPTMSLLPLNRLNDYVGVAAALRGLLAGAVLAMVWSQLASSTHLTWLTLRWLAGIGGPLIVWVMVRQILRFRNTQAATGVLFAGVILTFIGELTANLLFLELHQPL